MIRYDTIAEFNVDAMQYRLKMSTSYFTTHYLSNCIVQIRVFSEKITLLLLLTNVIGQITSSVWPGLRISCISTRYSVHYNISYQLTFYTQFFKIETQFEYFGKT